MSTTSRAIRDERNRLYYIFSLSLRNENAQQHNLLALFVCLKVFFIYNGIYGEKLRGSSNAIRTNWDGLIDARFVIYIYILFYYLLKNPTIFRVVVAVAADRSALPHRLVLPQRRHLQILRGRRRTRLPVSLYPYTGHSFLFSSSSPWPPIPKTKSMAFCCSWFKSVSLIFHSVSERRCAEGYKGQRCENKDIYNLGSKSSVWAFFKKT